jgi:hypothetical protein
MAGRRRPLPSGFCGGHAMPACRGCQVRRRPHQGEVMSRELVSVSIGNSMPSAEISVSGTESVQEVRHAGTATAYSARPVEPSSRLFGVRGATLRLVVPASGGRRGVAAGQNSVLATVSWANAHAAELYSALQPAGPRMPSAATWRRLLVHRDLAALEQQPAAHNQALDQADALPRLEQHRRCHPQLCQPAATRAAASRRTRAMKSPGGHPQRQMGIVCRK